MSEILSAYEQLRGKPFNFKEETVYLFLDEIRFWEGWQFEVKKYFDQKYPLKFILSGSSRQVQDAIIRRLEIIGEAVKNVDDDFRNKYPQIPWKKIAGMRDIIAHEYFGVKLVTY